MSNWFLPGTIITYAGSSRFTFNICRDIQDAFSAIYADNFYYKNYYIYRITENQQYEFICRVSAE